MMNTGEEGAEAKRRAKICHRKERMAERKQRKTSARSDAIAHREFEEADPWLSILPVLMRSFELAWHHAHNCKCPVVTRLQSINLTVGSLVIRAAP